MLDVSVFDKKKALKRGPAVVLRKDFGAVVAFTGLGSGDVVIEAGSGSGWATLMFANVVGKTGRVFSYEKREEFFKIAESNTKKMGFDNVDFKVRDVTADGFEEKDADLVFLDFGGSQDAVVHAFAALKSKGWIVGYLPNVEQMRTFTEKCIEVGFKVDKNISFEAREWLVREQGTRPENMGLVHTAFLCFARKP